MKNPYVILSIFITLIITLHNIAPEKIKYPITPKEVIADQYFDTTIVDPYRWLEDDY